MGQDGVGVNMVWQPSEPPNNARVSQVFAEVPLSAPILPQARVTQVFAEVVVST